MSRIQSTIAIRRLVRNSVISRTRTFSPDWLTLSAATSFTLPRASSPKYTVTSPSSVPFFTGASSGSPSSVS